MGNLFALIVSLITSLWSISQSLIIILTGCVSAIKTVSSIINFLKPFLIVCTYLKCGDYILSFFGLSLQDVALTVLSTCIDGVQFVILGLYELVSSFIVPVTFKALIKAPLYFLFLSLGWIKCNTDNEILNFITLNRNLEHDAGYAGNPAAWFTGGLGGLGGLAYARRFFTKGR